MLRSLALGLGILGIGVLVHCVERAASGQEAPPRAQPGKVNPSVVDPPPADGQPPPGGVEVLIERFPNGTVRLERQVEHDAKGAPINHGAWTAYYPDGKPVGSGTFVHGRMEGHWTRTFRRGEGPVTAGRMFADYQPPFSSDADFADGLLQGEWTIHDAKEKLVTVWTFAQGVPDGPWMWFYPSGRKRREASYAAGVPVGLAIDYDPRGKEIGREEFIDGRRKVFHSIQYSPGRKSWEGSVLTPKEIFRTRYDWWHGYADAFVVGQDGDEVRIGAWSWWYPDGQKQAEGSYDAGLPDGLWTWWHPTGEKWIEGAYVHGKESGEWTWFNQDGAVERTKSFPFIEPSADAPSADVPAADVPAADVPAGAGGPPADLPEAGAPPADE